MRKLDVFLLEYLGRDLYERVRYQKKFIQSGVEQRNFHRVAS